MWLSLLEIGDARLRSVAEIAPPQPFLCVIRSPVRYDFRGGAKPLAMLTLYRIAFCATTSSTGIIWTPIRYVTLNFRDRGGAVSLRAEITVLMCEQKPSDLIFVPGDEDIRDLTKPRRRRQWERQKTMDLMRKTTTLHVHHAFLYISLPSLHNYHVKWPNFKFIWERERQGDKFYHLCPSLSAFPFLQLQPKSPSCK